MTGPKLAVHHLDLFAGGVKGLAPAVTGAGSVSYGIIIGVSSPPGTIILVQFRNDVQLGDIVMGGIVVIRREGVEQGFKDMDPDTRFFANLRLRQPA